MCMGATFSAAFFTVDLEHSRRSSKIRSGDEERLHLMSGHQRVKRKNRESMGNIRWVE